MIIDHYGLHVYLEYSRYCEVTTLPCCYWSQPESSLCCHNGNAMLQPMIANAVELEEKEGTLKCSAPSCYRIICFAFVSADCSVHKNQNGKSIAANAQSTLGLLLSMSIKFAQAYIPHANQLWTARGHFKCLMVSYQDRFWKTAVF